MRIEVAPEEDGVQTLEFLSTCLIWVSKTRLRGLIGAGRVTLEGRKLSSGNALRAGAVVEIPDSDLPEADFSLHVALDILYEDASHLAVNKPAGTTVLPTRAGGGREFFNGLVLHLNPDWPRAARFIRPHIVHRLDRDTSGVLLIGKNSHAGSHLARQFEHRRTRKRYLALMEGVPPKAEFTVELPLSKKKGSAVEMAVDLRKGKPSATEFRIVRAFGRFSLVEAVPRTGRQHQIRVHAAAIGFPLAVDFLYGRRRVLTEADLSGGPAAEPGAVLLARCPLHAASLEYRDPEDGTLRLVEAPLPGDMARLIARLER